MLLGYALKLGWAGTREGDLQCMHLPQHCDCYQEGENLPRYPPLTMLQPAPRNRRWQLHPLGLRLTLSCALHVLPWDPSRAHTEWQCAWGGCRSPARAGLSHTQGTALLAAGDAASDVFVLKGLKDCALGNQLAMWFYDSIWLSMTFYAGKKSWMIWIGLKAIQQYRFRNNSHLYLLYFRRHFSGKKKLSDCYLPVGIAFAGFQGLIKMTKVLNADLLSMCWPLKYLFWEERGVD